MKGTLPPGRPVRVPSDRSGDTVRRRRGRVPAEAPLAGAGTLLALAALLAAPLCAAASAQAPPPTGSPPASLAPPPSGSDLPTSRTAPVGARPDPAASRPVPVVGRPAPSPDSLALHRAARDAQARFERLRLRHLPRASGVSRGGSCDDRVGRFCSWYDEGDWTPTPEGPELRSLRRTLLSTLDSVGRLLPGDDWVAGQRIWYRMEAGEWRSALAVARRCRPSRWWCDALEGLALHGAGRYQEADQAFAAALTRMERRESRAWRYPLRAVDGEAREALEAAREASDDGGPAEGSEGPGTDLPRSLAASDPPGTRLLHRFWLLADPLWLVAGNDRRTAHHARWTTSMIRVGARNPYRISWGRDLEELTVRHGWELGWERDWPRIGAETDVVGHKHPEGRDFFPPGSALLDPARATPEELEANRTRPRSLYAPSYAPLLLPMEGQVAVFPRADRMAVVATHFLPPDTSRHRDHDHPRPWLDPGDQTGLPERAGLFLAPVGSPLTVEDGELREAGGQESDPGPRGPAAGLSPAGDRSGVPGPTDAAARRPEPAPPGPGRLLRRTGVVASGRSGAFLLTGPAGRYVLSVERWSPPKRRAGRWRRGLAVDTVPPDVATLSDLLLVEAGVAHPPDLEEAAARALPRLEVRSGAPFGVVWEVGGTGWRSGSIRYTISLRREGGNVFERAGRWLGLLDAEEPLRLSWEEGTPEEPGRLLRHVELDPGVVEPGRYRLLLEVGLPGRGPLRSRREVRMVRREDAG